MYSGGWLLFIWTSTMFMFAGTRGKEIRRLKNEEDQRSWKTEMKTKGEEDTLEEKMGPI
jgi:hypothetical protein